MSFEWSLVVFAAADQQHRAQGEGGEEFDGVVLHIGGVFDGLESIFPAKGECGGQEVQVVHLGVKSGDMGFANLTDADDILNI